jgi:hypothetical protein
MQKQCVNAVQDKSCWLFWDPYKTHKGNVSTMRNIRMLNLLVSKAITRLWKVQPQIRQHRLRSGVKWQGAVCSPASYVTFHDSAPWKHQYLPSPSSSLSFTFFPLKGQLNSVLLHTSWEPTVPKLFKKSLQVRYNVHEGPPLVPILSKANQPTLPYSSTKTNCNVTSTMPRPFKRYLSFVFSPPKTVYISPFYHRRYVLCPFRPPWVCYPNNMWRKVHMMKLLIIKFFSSLLLPPVTWAQLFSRAPCSRTPSMFCPQFE